jgi:hypothetical protein
MRQEQQRLQTIIPDRPLISTADCACERTRQTCQDRRRVSTQEVAALRLSEDHDRHEVAPQALPAPHACRSVDAKAASFGWLIRAQSSPRGRLAVSSGKDSHLARTAKLQVSNFRPRADGPFLKQAPVGRKMQSPARAFSSYD